MTEGEIDVIQHAAMLLDDIKNLDDSHKHLRSVESELIPITISELRRIVIEDLDRKQRSIENQAALGDG